MRGRRNFVPSSYATARCQLRNRRGHNAEAAVLGGEASGKSRFRRPSIGRLKLSNIRPKQYLRIRLLNPNTPALSTISECRAKRRTDSSNWRRSGSDYKASFNLPDTNAAPAPHKQRQRALASAKPSKTMTTPLEAICTTISLFERRCAGGGRVGAGGGRRLHAVHGPCTRCGEAARPRAVHGRAHARVGSAFAALWITRSFSYLL